jgi:hypothetical protein
LLLSMLSMLASPAPHGATLRPWASRKSKPSAESSPVAQSDVALPPKPTTMWRHPSCMMAWAIIMPVPRVEACITLRCARGTSVRPLAAESSITAVWLVSSTMYCASTGGSPGSGAHTLTVWVRACGSDEAMASTVPSPPSATGSAVTCAPGTVRAMPCCAAWAISRDVAEPLNLSNASMILHMVVACSLIALQQRGAA